MNFTMEPTSQAAFLNINITSTSNGSFNRNDTTMNDVSGFTTKGILKAFSVAILIFFAISGNLIVCISFTMFRNLRSITNYFLVSLSISDILIATCTMPFWMLIQLYQPQSFFQPDQVTLRKFWYAMDFFLCFTAVCCLAAISVERNLAISRPFYYTKWVSPTRVYVTIAFLWLFAFAAALITTLNPFGKKSNLSIFIVLTSYFLPLLIIFAMYINIFLVARRQARRLRQDGALATDLKAITTIAIVIGTFFVCYTPYMIAIIWVHFRIGHVTLDTVSVVRWLTYFNSCVNPIIYSCFNKTYRRGFKRLFQTIAKKLHEMRVQNNNNGCSSRKLQRSRLSLNVTMRSSAGSLLDSTKVPSASGQPRGSVYSGSQIAGNGIDAISDKRFCNELKSGVGCEQPSDKIVQDTQQ